jgi:membrane fusion protein, multidrug efflux system
MKRTRVILVLGVALAGAGCTPGADRTQAPRSMEQIYRDEGVPVSVRALETESFSAYLKYPATLKARLESTASASVAEVVRQVNACIGDAVHKDDVIVSLSQDNANYQQARAARDTAEATYARFKTMFEGSNISPQDFDNIKVQHAQARAAFKTMDDIVNVKAPIDGYVTRMDVQISDNVSPGAPLFTVSNLGAIEAKLFVSGEEARMVRPGQAARIEEDGRSVPGTVTQVSLIMDAQRRAFPVTASFGNPDFALTSGLTADVALEVYRAPAIVVRQKELVREADTWYAFVVSGDVAQRRALRIGRQDGLRFEVLEGLRAGDLLVTEGAQSLNDSTRVRVVASRRNPG